ncbi:MAG: zf-HC2 domain-containing protein [Clostridia bacterium]|nr:zf-HC2 domain-containing protein [Clostridia bacterium]
MQDKECNFFKDQIYSYMSDGLSDAEAEDLLAHIESCPDCMRELDVLKTIISASAALPQVEVPDGLKASVFKRLGSSAQSVTPKRYKFKRFASVAIPAAACIALSIGVFSGGLYDKFVTSDNVISSGDINPAPIQSNTEQTNTTESTEPADTSANAVSDITPKSVPSKKPTPQPKEEQPDKNDVSAPQSNNTGAEAISAYDSASAPDDTPSAEEAVADTPTVASANSRLIAEPPAAYSEDVEPEANDAIVAASGGSAKAETSVPTSCIVITENISAFSDEFGVTADEGELHFELDADEWQDFLVFAENIGAELNADYSADSNGFVSITIRWENK